VSELWLAPRSGDVDEGYACKEAFHVFKVIVATKSEGYGNHELLILQ
jgi:hypothetical protein